MLDLESKLGLVVKEHIDNDYFIWLTTVDAKGTPQPRPVWFIWDEGSFLVFSEPSAYKVNHIKKNFRVSLHFNTRDKAGEEHIIVFVGDAVIDTTTPPAHKIPAYFEKYKVGFDKLDLTPEGFSKKYSTAIRIEPTEVRGWE